MTDKQTKRALETPGKLGALVNGHLQQLGVISRNMTDALAFCPPLIIRESEIDEIVSNVRSALDIALDEVSL